MAQKFDWNDNEDRFVLYLDIMGFKERVSRQDTEKLKKDLMSFKTKNKKLKPLLKSKDNQDLLKMTQFSDSIVVTSPSNTKEDLNRICRAAVILMQTAMETTFALRGSIALGSMVFDETNQLFFGKALVDAYLLEQQLAYYGIVFHESAEKIILSAMQEKEIHLPIIDEETNLSAMQKKEIYLPIIDEEVPLKNGKSSHFHIAWYLMDKKLKEGNISDDAIQWLKTLRTTVSGTPRIYLDNTNRTSSTSNK